MHAFLSLFNSREKAITIWLTIGLVLLLLRRGTRRSLLALLKSFFRWKILLIVLAMLLYVGLEVFGLYRVGFWDASLLKDTVLWTVTAFVLLLNGTSSDREDHYFRKVLLDNVRMTVLLEFVLNFYTFDLWIEITLVPVQFMFGAMSALAASDRKYLPTKKLLDFVLAAFGLYLAIFAIVSVVRDYHGFATINNLRSFLLPILLTFGYVPFLYATALCASYEILFSVGLLPCQRDHPTLVRYARWKIFWLCFLNLRQLTKFMKDEGVGVDLMNLKDRDDVVQMILGVQERGI